MSRFIVGGGISALIFKYYNPEYKIISSNIGGQLTDPWLGPRLLNDTRENRKLLLDLQFPIKELSCRIGYVINDKVFPVCHEIGRALYYRKSRCLPNKTPVPPTSMSSGSNLIKHLEVDWEAILNQLNSHNKDYISEDVSDINDSYVNGKRYHHLVWTPSLKILLKLIKNEELNLTSYHKFFIKSTECPFDMTPYDYLYLPQNEYPYHRITKVNDYYVFEYTRVESDYEPEPLPGQVDFKKLLNVQLIPFHISELRDILPTNIKLLGRFAEWDHSIKIEDVVRSSLEYAAQK